MVLWLQEVLHGLFKEPIAGPWNWRWRRCAILKIVKSPYLNEKLSDFYEIWYTTAHLELDDSLVTNVFLNARWLTATTLKSFFGHDWASDCRFQNCFI